MVTVVTLLKYAKFVAEPNQLVGTNAGGQLELLSAPDMSIPNLILKSRIWQKLCSNSDHVNTITKVREVCKALGEHISRTLPEYTDHSVRHMDALWSVADVVLTPEESAHLSSSEALVLGCSFYVHDVGMAYAATPSGLVSVRNSTEYASAKQSLLRVQGVSEERSDVLAIRLATRQMHAAHAIELARDPLPGLGRYLIEDTEQRLRWAQTIGEVSASHHWSLEDVHRHLGKRNLVPTADGDEMDLGYLACVLRIVDFAHINRERASHLDRALRSDISVDSVVHWDAQANITGPVRQSNYLVYGCTEPIQDLDAWWLFFDLATGLDEEITRVGEYLRDRTVSANRFSLQGVRGVESAHAFADFVKLGGRVAPIDIRVQPHSMERIIEFLGGKSLYGADSLAPIRELLQNARDAVELRRCNQSGESEPLIGEIDVTLDDRDGSPTLTVADNGVGMTRSIVARHLISIASDFWHSAEFFRDYSKALNTGFKPIGKFGIGFLSIFMLGDKIEVESESMGHPRVHLTLRGVGRRGELRELEPTGRIGTKVRVHLSRLAQRLLADLGAVVKARAPMLSMPINIHMHRDGRYESSRIAPGWWKSIPPEELKDFLNNWRPIAYRGSVHPDDSRKLRPSDPDSDFNRWPVALPDCVADWGRVIDGGADRDTGILRCSQGIGIDFLHVPNQFGLIESGEITLTSSRNTVLEESESTPDIRLLVHDGFSQLPSQLAQNITTSLRPYVIARLHDLESARMIPARLGFLRHLAHIYGPEILIEGNSRWIPVLEPPGNIRHVSNTELLEIFGKEHTVILMAGVGPAGAYRFASRRFEIPELSNTIILACSIDEVDVPYESQKDLEHEVGTDFIEGTLPSVRERTKSTKNPVIIRTFLRILAQAWQVPESVFENSPWILYYRSNVLLTRLVKSPATDAKMKNSVL